MLSVLWSGKREGKDEMLLDIGEIFRSSHRFWALIELGPCISAREEEGRLYRSQAFDQLELQVKRS